MLNCTEWVISGTLGIIFTFASRKILIFSHRLAKNWVIFKIGALNNINCQFFMLQSLNGMVRVESVVKFHS